MNIMELLWGAVQHIYFYLGAAVSGILVFLWCFFRSKRLVAKRASMINDAKIIDDLLDRLHKGEGINLEAVFPCDSTKGVYETPRYRAWRCFAYWIAHKYARFEYSVETKTEVLRLAAICFGDESMSYSKLCATEELLNRSTKYYLGEKAERLRDFVPIEYPKKLYDLVDLIIDSMYVNNY